MTTERRAVVQAEDQVAREIPGVTERDLRGRLVIPRGTIPWDVHLKAHEDYGSSQSAERINERGGFGYFELQCALAEDYWSPGGGLGVHEHPPVPGWMRS